MNKTKTTILIARLETAQAFCTACSTYLMEELRKIEGVNNIRCYPLDSLIHFTFRKANDLSTVLNVLSELGYPEKGEPIRFPKQSYAICYC